MYFIFAIFFLASIQSIDSKWRPNKRVNFSKIIKISAKANINIDLLCSELRLIIENDYENNRNKNRIKSTEIKIIKNDEWNLNKLV